MQDTTTVLDQPRATLSMHPKKFALWLFIVSVVMIFASLTSAYIVREAEGNWLLFEMPQIIYYNTIIIVLSSVTMQWAYSAAKKDNLNNLRIGLIATTALGFAFLAGQYLAWGALVDNNVFFVGNPAGSFMYVLTGLHGVHLISGVIFLSLVLRAAFKYKVHSRNLLKVEMCTTYWHFLGGLWVYLFIFLAFNH